ncbi:hypothetical protein [Diaphorobacter aerolatus]|nr:hypothetical protein [Diaphorobacter aerolatus]
MTVFQKIFLQSYRTLAAAILITVLLVASSYFFTIILYSANRTWVAPIILTKASPRVMATGAEAFRARQGLATLQIASESLRREIAVIDEQAIAVGNLMARYDLALREETVANAAFVKSISQLKSSKMADDYRASTILAASKATEQSIDQELAAGLITKEVAARARAQVVSMESNVTSAKLGTVALSQQIHDLNSGIDTMRGDAKSSKALESQSRVATLKQQLAALEIQRFRNNAELKNKNTEIQELQAIVDTVEATPYFRIAQDNELSALFAFVPYENESAVAMGKAIYSCWAKVVACARVGTVKWIGSDEEKGFHPIFQRDIRGFLIQLDLENPSAAKEQVLFLGSAPLFL